MNPHSSHQGSTEIMRAACESSKAKKIWGKSWSLSPVPPLLSPQDEETLERCLCREQTLTLRALGGCAERAGQANTSAPPCDLWQPQLSLPHAGSRFLLLKSCSNAESYWFYRMEGPGQQLRFYALARWGTQNRGTSSVCNHWVHTRLTESLQGKEKERESGDCWGWAPVWVPDCIQPPGTRWGNKCRGNPSHSTGVFCHGKLLWIRNGK